MSDTNDLRKRILGLPQRRLALLALELQEQLDRERSSRNEPIAVVGMACRFPGGSNSLDEYWHMLDTGRDAVVEVPADRWSVDELYDPDPDAPGKVATRWGGYLDDVQRFDAAFFSISPREARSMDPQQRLLLETCWRAFEDAAIPPSRLYGAKAGVFIGICNNDYLVRLLKDGPEAMDLYLSSGNAYSVAAGRLSFTFGFQGPAVAIDTACSSSLVAIHAACQSLRLGETSLAVAGGVNVMCSAETSMALSRSHMMAPDGRCKTFDEAADGFVRAEGCGVLLLKRLSDAVRDGDNIHAVLRGTATNQDGRSTGLTVPNGPAQEQVIRDALANAGLDPDDIDYVEAHGTGTTLGDPIEIHALGRVFGNQRDVPLYVGSVKTNMGHLESAAGVASVIKAILAVRAGRIPPHLHFTTPSHHIAWDQYAVCVAPDGAAWPDRDRPRRAGVSSFGFSGTNAHVIIEQAPTPLPPALRQPSRPVEIIAVSGSTREARDEISAAMADSLSAMTPEQYADFAHTTRVGRTHFPWRRAIVAATAHDAAAALRTGADVHESAGRLGDSPELVFMFTGQGSQHPGMGASLYQTAPAFRAAIDRCAVVLDPLLGIPLTTLLFEQGSDDAPIYMTQYAQPAVVAFEYALAELWRSWDVKPAAVVGHSLGEYAASVVAGVMRLEDMLTLVCERGRLLASLPGGQRMAAIFAGADVIDELVAAHRGAHVAAYNAPGNTVVSGDVNAVDALLESCMRRGIEYRVLRLDQAFHSPGVEPILDVLEAAAARVVHQPARLPIAWNVSGNVGGDVPDAGYWRRHARQAVRFTQGVQALAARGYTHFLEIGPHATLSPLVSQTVDDAVVIPSLHRDRDAWHGVFDAAARLFVNGADIDWQNVDDGRDTRRIPVPVHPFAGERYWVDPAADLRASVPRGAMPGRRLSVAVPVFETFITPQQPAFLGQHRFRGMSIVPGPMLIELARGAAAADGLAVNAITDFRIRTALFVPDEGVRVQTVIERSALDVRFRIMSAPAAADVETWTEHASGRIVTAAIEPVAPVAAPANAWTAVDVDAHMAALRELGFDLGRDAALYDRPEVAPRTARATLRNAAVVQEPVAATLHMDAALQVFGMAIAAERSGEARMLTGIDRIEFLHDVDTATHCVAVLADADSGRGDVMLHDAEGRTVVRMAGVLLDHVGADHRGVESWFHSLAWQPADVPAFERSNIDHAVAALGATWDESARQAGLPAYVDWLPALRLRVAHHIHAALVSLGMPATGELPDIATLTARLGIAEQHRRLFGRCVSILVESGALEPAGTGFRSMGAPAVIDTAVPDHCADVHALVERCGAELARVLTGRADPVGILFPGGSAESTRRIYRDSPFGRAFNDAIRTVVSGLVGDAHTDAPLRVLEIGAGSGSTTEVVLDALAGRTIEYAFTDVSPTLVAAAQAAFRDRRNIDYHTLDIERDPTGQGFVRRHFDIVIAANVLHATSDIARAVRNTVSLLRPAGALVVLEGTRPEPWVDITFGLTDGWWRFSDTDLRTDGPLIPTAAWQRVLRDAGLVDVTAAPTGDLADRAGQVVFVARRESIDVTDADSDRDIIFDARRATNGGALLDVMRAVVAATKGRRLWVVTSNTQSVGDAARPDPAGAVLWGLGRTFALEHPDHWGGLIDLEAGMSDVDARAAIARAVADPSEDQVAVRSGVRLRARLVATTAPASTPFRMDGGTVIVTGGLGGLGLKVSKWLAAAGATRVVLIGRTAGPDSWAADDPRHAELASLRESGIDVVLRLLDVADRNALEQLLADLVAGGPPLRGVVHAAAVFDEAPLVESSRTRLDRMLAPKADGVRNLVELTRGIGLDFYVLFSSTTALLGVAGLGHYAAANAYMDAYAARMRAEGLPILSINWGLWDEMRLADDSRAARYEHGGLLTMDHAAALDGLARALGMGAANAVIASVDWPRLRSLYEARRPRPLLAELGRDDILDAGVCAAPDAATPLEELAALPLAARQEAIRSSVERELHTVLRVTTGGIDTARGFFELGMDSLMSVELKGRLEKAFGTRLPATLTFNYPNVAAVTSYLIERTASEAPEQTAVAEPPQPVGVGVDSAELDEASLVEMLEDRLARLRPEASP